MKHPAVYESSLSSSSFSSPTSLTVFILRVYNVFNSQRLLILLTHRNVLIGIVSTSFEGELQAKRSIQINLCSFNLAVS